MKVRLYQGLTKYDKDGRAVEHQWGECDSFVRNFLQMLQGFLTSGLLTSGQIRNTAGTAVNSSADAYGQMNSISGLMSILIGDGAVAVDIDDYALGHAIPGVSSMLTSITQAESGQTMAITFTKTYLNEPSSTWTVRETGMITLLRYGNANHDILLVRDVLGSPITVTQGQSIQVQYYWQIV